jgi:hypothetical protein
MILCALKHSNSASKRQTCYYISKEVIRLSWSPELKDSKDKLKESRKSSPLQLSQLIPASLLSKTGVAPGMTTAVEVGV